MYCNSLYCVISIFGEYFQKKCFTIYCNSLYYMMFIFGEYFQKNVLQYTIIRSIV